MKFERLPSFSVVLLAAITLPCLAAQALSLQDLNDGSSLLTNNHVLFSDFEIYVTEADALDLSLIEVDLLSDGFSFGFQANDDHLFATSTLELYYSVTYVGPPVGPPSSSKKAAAKRGGELTLAASTGSFDPIPFSEGGSILGQYSEGGFIFESIDVAMMGTLAAVGDESASEAGKKVAVRKRGGNVDLVFQLDIARKKAAQKKAAGTSDPYIELDPDHNAAMVIDYGGLVDVEEVTQRWVTYPEIAPGIPEPQAALLFAAGAGLIGWAMRKRSRS